MLDARHTPAVPELFDSFIDAFLANSQDLSRKKNTDKIFKKFLNNLDQLKQIILSINHYEHLSLEQKQQVKSMLLEKLNTPDESGNTGWHYLLGDPRYFPRVRHTLLFTRAFESIPGSIPEIAQAFSHRNNKGTTVWDFMTLTESFSEVVQCFAVAPQCLPLIATSITTLPKNAYRAIWDCLQHEEQNKCLEILKRSPEAIKAINNTHNNSFDMTNSSLTLMAQSPTQSAEQHSLASPSGRKSY